MNRSALRDLIAERREATGRSYADIADATGQVTRAYVHRLATTDINRMPDPAILRALAVGLTVDLSAVLRAATQAIGIEVDEVPLPNDPNSRAIIAGVSKLSDEERETVARLVASIASRGARAPTA